MSKNGQTHFKNLTANAANAASFQRVSDHFGTLCIKGSTFCKIVFETLSLLTKKTFFSWPKNSIFWNLYSHEFFFLMKNTLKRRLISLA